jgi:orotidine-5'-phosphate decarboxylase
MTSQEKILKKNDEGKFICVGLDTDVCQTARFQDDVDGVLNLIRQLLKQQDYAAAYKINFAFMNVTVQRINEQKTVDLIPKDILSIADAKRGDIGNTSEMYAKSIYEHFKFDAVTLHPYMGKDSLQPFLDFTEKMNYVLVLTSNPGANDFEKLELKDGRFLYQNILDSVNDWNENKIAE